jgi:hypothetical protein
VEPAGDAETVRRLRAQATRIHVQALGAAMLATALTVLAVRRFAP